METVIEVALAAGDGFERTAVVANILRGLIKRILGGGVKLCIPAQKRRFCVLCQVYDKGLEGDVQPAPIVPVYTSMVYPTVDGVFGIAVQFAPLLAIGIRNLQKHANTPYSLQ